MVEEIKVDIDFKSVCRTCLQPNSILKNIFILDVIDGNILSFDKIYEEFSNTKVITIIMKVLLYIVEL